MKLTLAEITVLFDELNGRLISQQTGERTKTGLLSQKLSIKDKYILNSELNKLLSEEVKSIEESKLQIFKDLVAEGKGEEKDNQYTISAEHQPELQKRLDELSSVEKEIPVPNVSKENFFSIETDDYYPVFLEKLLAKEEAPVVESPSQP